MDIQVELPVNDTEIFKSAIEKIYEHWLQQMKEEDIASQLRTYVPTMLGISESVKVDMRVNAQTEVINFLYDHRKVILLLGDSGTGKTLFGQWLVNWRWNYLDFGNYFMKNSSLKYAININRIHNTVTKINKILTKFRIVSKQEASDQNNNVLQQFNADFIASLRKYIPSLKAIDTDIVEVFNILTVRIGVDISLNAEWVPIFIHLPHIRLKKNFLYKYFRSKDLTKNQINVLKKYSRILLYLDAYDETKKENQEAKLNLFRLAHLQEWNIKVIISSRADAIATMGISEINEVFGAETKLVDLTMDEKYYGVDFESVREEIIKSDSEFDKVLDAQLARLRHIESSISSGQNADGYISSLFASVVETLIYVAGDSSWSKEPADLKLKEYDETDYSDKDKKQLLQEKRTSNIHEKKISKKYDLTTFYIQSFDINKDIPAYIELWTKANENDVDPKFNYLETIKIIPGLSKMIKNPFILQIVMFTLPVYWKKYNNNPFNEEYNLTRLELYKNFSQEWFERQAVKLRNNSDISESWSNTIAEDFNNFCQQLAKCMWQKNINSVTYPLNESHDAEWDKFFSQHGDFDTDKKLWIVRRGALLRVYDNCRYAFLHDSLLEYFTSETLFCSESNNSSSAIGWPINAKIITTELAKINFAVDHLSNNKAFLQMLCDVIEESKYESRVQVAAANAISILAAANISFANKDLRFIRIPNANVSGGNFDGADLRDADLRGVNFSKAWLTRADLSGSCVDNIITGENFPSDEITSEIVSIYNLAEELEQYVVISKYKVDIFDSKKHTLIESTNLPLENNDEIIATTPSNDRECVLFGSKLGSLILNNFRSKDISRFNVSQHLSPILALAMSHDNKRALLCGFNNDIISWDLEANNLLMYWQGHTRGVNVVILENEVAFSGSEDRMIKMWDTKTGECLKSLYGHLSSVIVLTYMSKLKKLYSGSRDRTLRCWNVETGDCLKEFKGHTDEIRSLALNQNNNWLFSGARDKTIRKWDLNTGECKSTWNAHSDAVSCLLLIADDSMLISGSYDRMLKRWETTSTQCLLPKLSHHSIVDTLHVSTDFRSITSIGKDGYLKTWDSLSGKQTSDSTCSSTVKNIAILANANWAVGLNDHNELIKFDKSSGNISPPIIKIDQDASSLLITHNGEYILIGCCSGDILQFDTLQCVVINSLKAHKERVNLMFESPKNKILYSVSIDKTICCWDIQNTECKLILNRLFFSPITSFAFDHSYNEIILGSEDGSIMRWHSKSINQNSNDLTIWKKHEAPINALALSNDSLLAISGDEKNKVILWSVKNGLNIGECHLPAPVTAVKWSPHNDTIIIGMADGSVSVWKYLPKNIKLLLLWRTDPWHLVANNSIMTSAYGLSMIQEKILTQRGMKIQFSSKESNTILEKRENTRYPFDIANPPCCLFDRGIILRENAWAVSVVRSKSGENKRHALLVLESVENGYYQIRQIDFFLELRQRMLTDDSGKPTRADTFGQGLIEIVEKSLRDMSELIKDSYVKKPRAITAEMGNRLLKNIQKDQTERIGYCLMGKSPLYSIFRIKEAAEHHNCISWCEKHLSEIGINDLLNTKWYDPIVEYPPAKLTDEPNSGEKCNMM